MLVNIYLVHSLAMKNVVGIVLVVRRKCAPRMKIHNALLSGVLYAPHSLCYKEHERKMSLIIYIPW